MFDFNNREELLSILESARVLGSKDASESAYNSIEQGMSSFEDAKQEIRRKINAGAEVNQDDKGNIIIDNFWYIINRLF